MNQLTVSASSSMPMMAQPFSRTSAGGLLAPSIKAGVVGLFLFMSGLSVPSTASSYRPYLTVERTVASPDGQLPSELLDHSESCAEALFAVRRISGLTLDEISDVFGVTRRSLHHWMNGRPVAASNERIVREVAAAMRHMDFGDQSQTRRFLLTPDERGLTPLDLIKQGNVAQAIALTEKKSLARPTVGISEHARKARSAPPPVALLESIEDRPEIAANGRVARAIRVKKSPG